MINSLGQAGALIILLVLAILLEHVVAWAGSVLYSAATFAESKYAVYTFREDQNKPLTTNILMNILIPNVAMVFVYMLASKFSLVYIVREIVWFTVFYYVYRAVLICVILRRKELFRVGYEVSVAGISVVISILLNHYFFVNSKNVFIPVSELANELWIAIFLVLYQFLRTIIDKHVTQNAIIKKPMMVQYIAKKFHQFYKKYGDLVDVHIENRSTCILLYSIMIFEDYNRGPLIRKLECIKCLLTGSGTLGIMQVKSNHVITDQESVILAYEKLQNEIVQDGYTIYDDYLIEQYAFEYNNDDDYAASVSSIYGHLRDYLDEIPKYRKAFFLREEMEREEEMERDEEIEEVPEPVSWLTVDDLVMMTGLEKKEILKKMRKANALILMREDEARAVLDKYMAKG
ncbi:MAG: hypothetical protein SOZ17_08905 [Agathobacter sp.]|nr:hypothetical protein [Agathobacter sp.]